MPPEADVLDAAEPEEAVVAGVVGVLDAMERGIGDRKLGRLLIGLANTHSPHQVAAIYRLLADNTSPNALDRLTRLAPQWHYYRSRKGAVFSREVVEPETILYRSAVKGIERGAMVCFAAGPDNTMFMSNCRWLELFGEMPLDIVILSNSRREEVGRWALDGQNLHLSLARLMPRLAERGVRPRCFVGASAGGEPALVAATLYPDCTGIALAGRFFTPGRAVPLAEAPTPFLPLCACWPGKRPRLHSFFGADEPLDAEDNARLAALAPHARIYPIPNDSRHNPMATLAARGKLRAVAGLIAEASFGRDVDFSLVSEL